MTDHEPPYTLAAQIKREKLLEDFALEQRLKRPSITSRSRQTPSWPFCQVATFPLGTERNRVSLW